MKNSDSEFRKIIKRYEEEKAEKLIEMTCKTNLLKKIKRANILGKKANQIYSGKNFYKDI